MSTRLLFQEDSYLKSCKAEVIEVQEKAIILDQTCFYPLGGGQPGDQGKGVLSDGGVINIVDTRKDKVDPTRILHLTDQVSNPDILGQTIDLELDWEKRYNYMKMHTCMHIFCSLLPYPVTGGNISYNKGRLDFDIDGDIPDKQELTEELNSLIKQNIELSTRWITDDEMAANMDLVKTMSVTPPMGYGKVRLVEIPGIDLQPCGGTHLSNTSEVGEVLIKKIENKGKQNKRFILNFAEA
ncbi:MAG: alanyl-tRNA editing protein [Gammaproteobacteria bacterium]|nr:alanyl-tRNA editing protein [Gammaproteobacteria bacterium]